jgi:hypothetical protein
VTAVLECEHQHTFAAAVVCSIVATTISRERVFDVLVVCNKAAAAAATAAALLMLHVLCFLQRCILNNARPRPSRHGSIIISAAGIPALSIPAQQCTRLQLITSAVI